MSAENRAFERMSPGTNNPVYETRVTSLTRAFRHMTEGWRINTPPIVESLDETLEHVLAKQGREDNRGPS